MKSIYLLVFYPLILLLAFGQREPLSSRPGNGVAESKTLRITGTRLVHPIFRKWIEEYTKLHPGVTILLDSRIPADSADLVIVSHRLEAADLKKDRTSVILNRYVQLPVVNSHRSDVAALQSKGFTEADFRRIYFGDQDNTSDNRSVDPIPGAYHFAVYKREKSACASRAFANHFGSEQKDIKGVGIKGDDKDLLDAVISDTNGISYNNLGFLYDLKTRKPVEGIAIIPLDLDGDGKIDPWENFYGDLDQVIAFAEKAYNRRLLVENVHVIFSASAHNEALAGFLQWILTEGQKYDHAYGFLVPGKETLHDQQEIVSATLRPH
jgi:phosphate transport system substrate-binding protein